MEMLTAMLMPAKRRLLLPKMEASALLGACGGAQGTRKAGPRWGSSWGRPRDGHEPPTRSPPEAMGPSPTFFFQEPRMPGTASWSRLMASLCGRRREGA